MENKTYILPKKLLVAFSGIGIAMVIGLFYNAYSGLQVNMNWLYVSIILNFVAFLAVIIHVIKHPTKNKWVWLIFLVILPFLSTFAYLVSQEKK